MSDAYEHNPDDHEDPVAGLTWFLGLIGVLLMVVTVLGLTALYYTVKAQEVEVQFIGPERLEVIELRARQEELLQGPPRRVVREELGETVEALVIPLDQAMQLVVEEVNTG